MYVREDTMRLYGFATLEEQAVFELLISVSSIGPRLALNMLSSLSAADVQQAIAQGETDGAGIPGVGRKTAERVVVELKDKMAALDMTSGAQPASGTEDEQVMRDVVSALLNLVTGGGKPKKRCVQPAPNRLDSLTSGGAAEDAYKWC